MEFSADQIIGKTLYALRPTPITRAAAPGATVIYTVAAGQPIGVVDTYIKATPATGNRLYWSFLDDNQRPYYAAHEVGQFDFQSLVNQGAISEEDKRRIEAEAAATPWDKASGLVKWLAVAAGVVVVAKAVFSSGRR